MKIYTRTGDAGETGLYGGERTSKSSLRVSAYGSVDEASTFIGFARAQLNDSDLDAELVRLQSTLFELGADLATPHTARQREKLTPTDARAISGAENLIDPLDPDLGPLTPSIFPVGDPPPPPLVRRSTRRNS